MAPKDLLLCWNQRLPASCISFPVLSPSILTGTRANLSPSPKAQGCITLIGQAEALAYPYNPEQSQFFLQQVSRVRKVGAPSKEEVSNRTGVPDVSKNADMLYYQGANCQQHAEGICFSPCCDKTLRGKQLKRGKVGLQRRLSA